MDKFDITITVTDGEKEITFPWSLLKGEFLDFIHKKGDPLIHETFEKVFHVVEARVRCVYMELYEKSLIS